MPGAPDPLYVNAREVLLDALEALGAHRAPNRAARKARGLEGALVDHETREIGSFDGPRRFAIAVAGPAALLVSKLHKLAERAQEAGRTRMRSTFCGCCAESTL